MQRSLDEEILAYAARHDRVVVTHDSDFSRLLAMTAAMGPSVIHVRTHESIVCACSGSWRLWCLRSRRSSVRVASCPWTRLESGSAG